MLVLAIFAFAYIIKDADNKSNILIIQKRRSILSLVPLILKLLVFSIFNEKTLVSALESSDLQKGVSTCAIGKDGSICQEYPASECDSRCKNQCIPTTRENVPSCKLGTCYDSDVGTCQERAPREACENDGGIWFDDVGGNVQECQKACCVVGDDVRPLVTARECAKIQEISGVKTNYKSDIREELSCLALSRSDAEGACVFGTAEDKSCRFIVKKECLENGGEFFEGFLCTHPDLNMGYKKQATAKCVEGRDEIYWFDSEGNRENIYDANKEKSWNNGKLLIESDSCSLGDSRNALKNQRTCGNCNRLLGSACGQKTQNEKLSDNSIDVVCRDRRCVDSEGRLRENGESWCGYQGAIGTDKGAGGFLRSVDTPGSRHFRNTCIDGEIQIDPCADYRNEVCVEDREKRNDGNEISNAACVTNLWQLCLNYNALVKSKTKIDQAKETEDRNKKCTENPHCQLKKVDIDDFQFDTCVPKYSPGFDLQKNAEGGELSCSFANQKCTVFYVKEIGGWKCKANCDCEKAKFAEQMNDLCMSLGDCGASANYIGDITENYRVKKTPKLGKKYLDEIKQYSEPVKGQYASVNATAYLNAVGGIARLGGSFSDPNAGLSWAGTIAGLTGTVLIFAAHTEVPSILATFAPVLTSPAVVGISGVLAGAAIGFAITALLIQYTGIAGGLDPFITNSLLAGGTVAGALIGAHLVGATSGVASFVGASAGTAAAVALSALIIGLVLLLVVVVLIVVFLALGVGDTKKKIVEFECKPWQPALGGLKCDQCGKDGYPCSKYACQSLGQTCRFINEGTGEEKCVDISPNDVSAPIIKPWEASLTSGFKYEDISDSGVKIVSQENDGCVKSYENVVFGIELNEPGYCRFDYQNKNNFDEMEFDFGSRNLFLEKHAQFFTVPDLTSLGVPGYDPTRRADLNFHVRCIDGNGNGKNSAEYVINLCVKPGEDKTPPIITGRNPFREEAAFGLNEIKGSIFTNEPATCKWSLADKSYDSMENSMECSNDVVDREALLGWECGADFPIDKEENRFYIKCKDQPWYGEGWQGEGSDSIGINESKRNEMRESYLFLVKPTKTPLIIDSIKPNNQTLIFGVQPATVVLEVETSGGVDGKATCNLFGSPMQETFGSLHKQIFNRIFAGSYEFPILCQDSVGNNAEGLSKFDVALDVTTPIVTRVYNQNNILNIVTNEVGECYFFKTNGKDNSCGFASANGTLMEGNELVHTTSLENIYYSIKCKDVWGNYPSDCNVVVREGAL